MRQSNARSATGRRAGRRRSDRAGRARPPARQVGRRSPAPPAGIPWVASDGNAATATTEFTDDITRLDGLVDWPLMSEKRWNSTQDDPDRQRRRMAEFLVYRRFPLELVRWIAAHDEDRAGQVRGKLADLALADRIIVRPTWYYGYEREVK